MRTTSFFLAFILTATVMAQTQPGVDDKNVYHNPAIGFSFTTPDGLRDVTKQADNSGNNDPKTIQLLLFELSGPDSTDLNWRGLALQSFSRSQVSASSDFEAELRLSRTIIGKATPTAEPAKITIGDIDFAYSQFQRARGVVTEHARVYATLIHDQIVAFAFTANSELQLDSMAESLKTIRITPGKPAKE